MQALDRERECLQEDLHRTSDDLESITRENQAITASLTSSNEEGSRWHAEARSCGARVSHLERVLGGKEAEIGQLRSACEVSRVCLCI